MGILDSVLGGLMGGGGTGSPMGSVLGSLLGGGGAGTQQQSGIAGLVQRFTQAGHGDVANSWVGQGANQPADPGMLQRVFGQQQINQWSQQTGMPQNDLLSQLSQFLPHAVDQMTPQGQVPAEPQAAGQASSSPFDEGGVELGGPGTRQV